MANTLLAKAVEVGYITEQQQENAEKYKKDTGVSDEVAILDMKLLPEEKILEIYDCRIGQNGLCKLIYIQAAKKIRIYSCKA